MSSNISPQIQIEKARKLRNQGFHRFAENFSKYSKESVFCFVEGKDDSGYYFPRINEYFDNIELINCNNKKGVIFAHSKLIGKKEEGFHLCFFVDKDFDKNNLSADIYITPVYSIENFYCSKNFINKVLKSEFYLNSKDEEYIYCIDLFNLLFDSYLNAILLFNAWYYAQKISHLKNGEVCEISLNENLPKGFVEVNFESSAITIEYDLDKIYEHENKGYVLSEADVAKYYLKLKENNLAQCMRGKYVIWFIKKYLAFLIEEALQNPNSKYIKDRPKLRLVESNFISQLSQYADTPECLVDYLSKIKNI